MNCVFFNSKPMIDEKLLYNRTFRRLCARKNANNRRADKKKFDEQIRVRIGISFPYFYIYSADITYANTAYMSSCVHALGIASRGLGSSPIII